MKSCLGAKRWDVSLYCIIILLKNSCLLPTTLSEKKKILCRYDTQILPFSWPFHSNAHITPSGLTLDTCTKTVFFCLFKDFFFFVDHFKCGPFKKSLLSLLQYCFYFLFWFFGHKARVILASWPGTEPYLLHWKAKS